MRVCLLHPQDTNYASRIMDEVERGPHLGLGYIAAMLLKNNIEVDIVDGHYQNLSANEVINQIKNNTKYDVYGFSLYNTTFDICLRISSAIKSIYPDTHITLGGHFPSFKAVEILEKYDMIDSIIRGEGEYSFAELCNSIESDNNLSNVKNLVYKEEGQVITNPMRELIQDLDSLPFPMTNQDDSSKISYIIGSRGCYGNCSFCSIKNFYKIQDGQSFRCRSPLNVVSEIKNLYRNYNKRVFIFNDDNFFTAEIINPGWIKEFSELLIQRDLAIKFSIKCRLNDVEKTKFDLLKKCGLTTVSFGVETAVQRIQDIYSKKINLTRVYEVLQFLMTEGYSFDFGFILFDPYTSIDEFNLNLDFFESIQYWKLPVYHRPISSFPELVVTDGCDIYKRLLKDNLIISNENYSYKYKFADDKMNILYTYFLEWRKSILKIRHINVFSYFKLDRNREDLKKYVSLCSQYLLVDYMFLRKATNIIINDNSPKDQLNIILNEMKIKAENILSDLLKYTKNK